MDILDFASLSKKVGNLVFSDIHWETSDVNRTAVDVILAEELGVGDDSRRGLFLSEGLNPELAVLANDLQSMSARPDFVVMKLVKKGTHR